MSEDSMEHCVGKKEGEGKSPLRRCVQEVNEKLEQINATHDSMRVASLRSPLET